MVSGAGTEGMSGNREPKREQCWVINNEVDPPPPAALSKEELTARHHDFIHELEAKGSWSAPGRFSTIPAIASAPA